MNKLTEVSIKNGYKATCNHYRKLIYPLSLILLVFFLTSSTQAKYSGGTGEPNNPYQIADANDMNEIGTDPNDWDKHFKLVADINLGGYTGTQFNIIGISYTNAFTGVFDGNGHTISNFTYDTNNTERIGLFGFVDSGAEIRNLAMENVSVNGGCGKAIGGLAGVNNGIISNCNVGGTISGNQGISGLVGLHLYGMISGCSVKGSVSGNAFTGGLVGWNGSIILYSYADCTVSGKDHQIGGLVGFDDGGMISNCYSTGAVDGNSSVGGLIGGSDCGTISNCYATALVVGSSDIGGLVGESFDSSFAGCFWNKDVDPSLTGVGNTGDPNGVIGEITANMKKEHTFVDAGWDFIEIWNIGENQTYPYLRVYPAGDLNHDRRVNFMDFAIFADHWLAGVE